MSAEAPLGGQPRSPIIGGEFGKLEFDAWSNAGVTKAYDSGFGPTTRQCIPSIIDSLSALKAQQAQGATSSRPLRVLDVATGPGYIAAAAASAGHEAVGLDCSEEFLRMAEQTCQGMAVELVTGDAQALRNSFDAGSFDAVLCGFGVLHLPEPRTFFKEAAYVLREGGLLAFTVWQTPPAAEGFQICIDAVKEKGNPHVPLPEGPSFFLYADPKISKEHLQEAGFDRVESQEVPMTMKLPSSEDLFSLLLEGTARTRALLKAQEPADLEAIKQAITANYEAANLEVAMPCVLVTGRRA